MESTSNTIATGLPARRAGALRRAAVLGLAAVLLAGAGATLGGCRGDRTSQRPRQFFPDMDTQPKYVAQERSTFFAEYLDKQTGERYGRTQRQPVNGTVPFGRTSHVRYEQGAIVEVSFGGRDFTDRARFGHRDPVFMTGKPAGSTARNGDASGDWVEYIPVEVTRELIELGRAKYDIYCLPCHGGLGMGDGTVAGSWSYAPANLQSEQYLHGGEKGKDGHLFDVILNGVPKVGGAFPYAMRGYRGKVSEHEAWAIVSYIRVLQQSQRGTPDMLTPTMRGSLGQGGPAATGSVSESTHGLEGEAAS